MPFKKGHIKTGGMKKGQIQRKTILKEKIGKSLYESSAEAVDRNMHEFLNSKDAQTKLIATKYFGKFFRAEKKEITGSIKMPIILQVNPKIIRGTTNSKDNIISDNTGKS